jgi:hypothetical protein
MCSEIVCFQGLGIIPTVYGSSVSLRCYGGLPVLYQRAGLSRRVKGRVCIEELPNLSAVTAYKTVTTRSLLMGFTQ